MPKIVKFCPKCKQAHLSNILSCPVCGETLINSPCTETYWETCSEEERSKIICKTLGIDYISPFRTEYVPTDSVVYDFLPANAPAPTDVSSDTNAVLQQMNEMNASLTKLTHDVHFIYIIVLIEIICAVIAPLLVLLIWSLD